MLPDVRAWSDWKRERLSRIIGVDKKGVRCMDRKLAGTGLWAVVVGTALAMGSMTASAQSTPIPHAHIYPDIQAAQPDIQAALVKARHEHKRVILDFGADWCPDCQVLNIYFHQSPNAELLAKHFVLVDVNIGRMDANLDIAHKYGVPVQGVH